MTQPDTPKIEFPLNYPIKVIGDNSDGFQATVVRIVTQFDPKFDASSITLIPSRNGTFVSLRLSLWATGEDQLQGMYKALKETGHVKMIL